MVDRSVVVRLRANVRDFNRDIGTSTAAVGTLESRLRSADKVGGASIDRLSGRVKILADLLAILGPAAAPIGALAVPAVAGLAAQLGFAVTGALGFVVAVQGIGDGLEALNKAHLEPTTENLAAAELAMENLTPAGESLTRQLFALRDEWQQLRDVSQEGLAPGLSAALDSLEERLPDVERILQNVNEAVGELLADGAESLASDRWDDFFTFIATDAPPALSAMGEALGNISHAMAELWMAFDPLNDDFATWLVDSTARLDEWADGLDQTQGFQDFVDYIRENGPQVAETLGAVSMAILHIVEAAAPLGGPVLAALEAVATAISAIATSDAGPAIMATVTALALLRRGMATLEAVQGTTWAKGIKGADTFAGKVTAARTPLLRTSAALAGLAIASSDTADGFLLSNTASGAMLGMLGGPWGAAVGGAVGLMMDLSKSTGTFKVNTDELTATLDQQTGAITRNTTAYTANELEKQGVLRAAQDLGLNLNDVTQAALGNADAMLRVQAGLDAAKSGFYDAEGRVVVGTTTLQKYGEQSFLVTDAIGTMSGELETGQGRVRRMADATDAGANSLTRAESAAQDFADAITRLNNVLSGRAAMRDYEAAVDDFAAALKENGRSFDINTEKGRANQAALDNIAGTAIRVAENLKGAARQRFLTNAIADLREMGGRFGVPKAETQRLIELLREANNADVKPKIDVDTGQSLAKIAAVRNSIASLRDRSLTITTVYDVVRNSTDAVPYRGKAFGDFMDRHDPEIAPGGAWRVWAEPETQGESYIPHANDSRRPRAKRILEHTADKFGGQVLWFAEGGTTGDADDETGDGTPKRRRRRVGAIPAETAALIRQFGSLTRAIKASEQAVEKETSRRDALRDRLSGVEQQMADIADAATAGFSGDPFRDRQGAPRGSIGQSAGGSDPIAALMEDIAYGQRRDALIKDAQRAGLGGSTAGEQAALAEALRGADNDALAAMLAAGTIQQFEDLFIQRQGVIGGVGGNAAELVHGAEFQALSLETVEQTAELREVKAELRALRQEARARENRDANRARENAESTGAAVKEGVNSTASATTRHNRRKRRPRAGAR